ncbi:MAG: GNAT family N-acetyltransferase [Balneolales bacterium]
MNIQHQSGETKGEFFIEDNGEVKAQLSYSKMGNTGMIIDHTQVSDDLRGKSVGKKLVEHAITYARKNELEVIPLCPYTKSVIEKDESLQDVLKR